MSQYKIAPPQKSLPPGRQFTGKNPPYPAGDFSGGDPIMGRLFSRPVWRYFNKRKIYQIRDYFSSPRADFSRQRHFNLTPAPRVVLPRPLMCSSLLRVTPPPRRSRRVYTSPPQPAILLELKPKTLAQETLFIVTITLQPTRNCLATVHTIALWLYTYLTAFTYTG